MKQTMIACLLFAGFFTSAQATDPDTLQLNELIHAGLARHDIPGLSIVIVKDSSFYFQRGYGNTKSIFGKKVTSTSIFNVASLSKPVAAYTAIQYLFNAGISPDTDRPPTKNILSPTVVAYGRFLQFSSG